MVVSKRRRYRVIRYMAVLLLLAWIYRTIQSLQLKWTNSTARLRSELRSSHYLSSSSRKQLVKAVPHRLAKINQAGVEFVMAVELNRGDFLSDILMRDGHWEVGDAKLLAALVKEKLTSQLNCLFLDVGANQGIHSIYMAKLGCRVVAFEMQQHVAELMQTSLFLNHVDAQVSLVVSPVYDVPKNLFYVPDRVNLGGTRVYEEQKGDPGEILVQSVRIDDIVKERIDIMKLDVEGSEYHALKSMSKLFERDMVGEIIMEVWGTSHAPVQLLYELGYKPQRKINIGIPIPKQEMMYHLKELKLTRLSEDFLFRKAK